MTVQRRVIVVGAGPGGLAAAARLAERSDGAVAVTLVAPSRRATFLAGALDVGLDGAEPSLSAAEVDLVGVEAVDAEVSRVAADGVWIDSDRLPADAVIAAPGLALRPRESLPDWPHAAWAWDPWQAVAAHELIAHDGSDPIAHDGPDRIVVAACGAPYRCPPAPFALAIGLADRRARLGRSCEITVVSPEPIPLAAVGGPAPALIQEACDAASVRVEAGFAVDLAASEDRVLRSRDGRELAYDAAWMVPPHERSPCLAGLPGEGPLVTVDGSGRAEPGLFVIGDAAATGMPRAAGVARSAGARAADVILEELGVHAAAPREPVRASCYLFHVGGRASRIRVEYAGGEPRVEVDGPSEELLRARADERRQFLRLAAGN